MGDLVELEVVEAQRVRVVLLAPGAAQHRADPGDDLLEAEGLGHIVVPADGQPLDLVVEAVPGGDEDDRDVPAALAQLAGHREAVEVGEHDVEDDEVGIASGGEVERGGSVGGHRHLETGEPERGREQLTDVRLVLDDEQAGLWLGLRHGRQCVGVR